MRIGIVGAGHLGKVHIKCLKDISEWDISGFYDTNAEVRKAVSEELGVAAFDSLDALIEASDAIDVVTSTPAHHRVAAAALSKGRHVFIEKPISSTVEEARDIKQKAEAGGLVVQVGHVERFNPAYLSVKERLSSPLFIEAHRLSPYKVRGNDISVIMDLMIHDLDLVLSLVDRPLKSVHANGVAVISDTPDICHARLAFEGGCVANLTASRLSLKPVRKMRIFQKDAYLSMDFLERSAQVVHMIDEAADIPENAFLVPMELPERSGKIVVQQPSAPEVNAILEELSSFYRSITSRQEVAVSLDEATRALELALEIESVLNKERIEA